MTYETNIPVSDQNQILPVVVETRSVGELVADPDSIRAAFEWGLEAQEPTVLALHSNLIVPPREVGSLMILSPGFSPSRGYEVVIRDAIYDKKLSDALNVMKSVHMQADTNNFLRRNYEKNAAHQRSLHRRSQGLTGAKNAAYSAADAALAGSAPLANNILQVVAYQADAKTAIGAAGLGLGVGVIKGIREAIQLRGKHRRAMDEVRAPEPQPNAEELCRTLVPLLEQINVLIDASQPSTNEARVGDQEYTMNFDHVEKMLKKNGGSKYGDYEAVLHDLKARAKVLMHDPSISARHKIESREYVFNPATIVREMLIASKGEVATVEFMERVTELGKAQFALKKAEQELNAFRTDTNRVPGTGGKKREDSLEEDVNRLKDAVDFYMLQTFKLNAQYLNGERREPDFITINPYHAPDVLESGHKPGEPSDDEPEHVAYGSNGPWPVLGEESPRKRKDIPS